MRIRIFVFKTQACRMNAGDKQDFYFLKCKEHTKTATTNLTQTALSKHVTLSSKNYTERNEIKATFKRKLKQQKHR